MHASMPLAILKRFTPASGTIFSSKYSSLMNAHQQQRLEKTREQVERLRREHPLRDLFWECTLRCNMSCRHCGSDCLKESQIPDMPFADFLPVLDEVAAHCDPAQVMVQTVGGEPLVRPDLMDCGRAITERGFMWGLRRPRDGPSGHHFVVHRRGRHARRAQLAQEFLGQF